MSFNTGAVLSFNNRKTFERAADFLLESEKRNGRTICDIGYSDMLIKVFDGKHVINVVVCLGVLGIYRIFEGGDFTLEWLDAND